MIWYLTLFGDDDLTVIAEISTDPAHPKPFLFAPEGGAESEVNLLEGSSVIGQIPLRVLDKRTKPADQSTGWLTALLADAAGESARIGRRVLLQQAETAAAERVTVMDGVAGSMVLDESLVVYTTSVRDIRERERKLKVFARGGTSTVFPRGVMDGYGALPGGGWLVPPVTPRSGVFDRRTATFGFLDFQNPADKLPPDLVLTRAMQEAVQPVWSEDSDSLILPDVAIIWRTPGGAWNELVRMPIREADLGWVDIQFPLFSTTNASYEAEDADGERVEVPCKRIKGLYLSESEGVALPADGATVEVVVRHVGEPSEDYPLHIEGTAGEILKALYDGEYTTDEEGLPAATRLRYDEAAVLALATPIRARITEPEDNLREWTQRNIYAPLGAAPALDELGRIAPIRYELPDANVVLTEINNSNTIDGSWEHSGEDAKNYISTTYNRDYRVRDADDPIGERSAGDGISTQMVEVIRKDRASITLLGKQEHKIEAVTLRAIGGDRGQPWTGDVADEIGHQVATERGVQALDRFVFGGQRIRARCLRSATKSLKAGDWVLVALSWLPDYKTGVRGSNRLAQIIAAKDLDPATREFRLVDAGAANQPIGQPTLGTLNANDAGVVSIPVVALPVGGLARVDYAISDVLPASDSGLWRFLGRADSVQTLTTPPAPAGATVWVRARGEARGRRRSAWTNAINIVLPQTPRVRDVRISIDPAGGPTVSWSPNAFALGVRIYFEVHAPGADPGLATFIEADASLGTLTLPVTVGGGEMLTAQIEPWTGWTGAAVSGVAGQRVSAVGGNPALPAIMSIQYASDDQGSDSSTTFDPAIHTYARWSDNGGATWTTWFRMVGENGASTEGRYPDIRFRVSTTQPATPTGENPVGWFDAPPAYDPDTGAKLWMTIATKDGATGALLSTWSVPRQLTGPEGVQGPPGNQGIQGPAGADGESNYFHITYADSADGTVNFNQTAGEYVGTYVDGNPTDSSNPADYAWKRFQGIPGDEGIPGVDGVDGQTSYLHIAYADTAVGGGFSQDPTGKAYIGTYVDFNQMDSADASLYTWMKVQGPQGPAGDQGIQGPAGVDGESNYFHIAYADSADGTVNFNQTAGEYVGTYVDGNPADSSNSGDYAWKRFQGIPGDEGIPGVDGVDGQTSYLHIAYANDAVGNGFSQDPTGKVYIGTYVDFTQTDSIDPADYTWAKIEGPQGPPGPQGEQGIQGPAGVDGESNYFHIAYADSADGTVNFNQSAGEYVGTYVDGNPADSASPAAYQWQRFKGVAGDEGIPGVDGVDGQTSYLHIAYADTATGGGFSQGPTGKPYMGTYVDFVQADGTDPALYTWVKVEAPPGPPGGAFGLAILAFRWMIAASTTLEIDFQIASDITQIEVAFGLTDPTTSGWEDMVYTISVSGGRLSHPVQNGLGAVKTWGALEGSPNFRVRGLDADGAVVNTIFSSPEQLSITGHVGARVGLGATVLQADRFDLSSTQFSLATVSGRPQVSLAGSLAHLNKVQTWTNKQTFSAGLDINGALRVNNFFELLSDESVVGGWTKSYYQGDAYQYRLYPVSSAGATLSVDFSVGIYHNGAYGKVWHSRNFSPGDYLPVGGKAANADKLDNFNLESGATASTVVARDAFGDIYARLFRGEFTSLNAQTDFIMTQREVGAGTDNYLRPATLSQVKTNMGLSKITDGGSDTYVSISLARANVGDYSGIRMEGGGGHILMFAGSRGGLYSGTAWSWMWDNGTLLNGTVPWARITGSPDYLLKSGGAISGVLTLNSDLYMHAAGTAFKDLRWYRDGNLRWLLRDDGDYLRLYQYTATGGYIANTIRINAVTADVNLSNSLHVGGALSVTSNMGIGGNLDTTGTSTASYFRAIGGEGGLSLYDATRAKRIGGATSSYWYMGTSDTVDGGMRFYQGSGGDFHKLKGVIYWSSSGFGLLNETAGWSIRCWTGAGNGGTLYGTWRVTGDIQADGDAIFGLDKGVFGTYDSTKYRHVWSMGAAYRLAAGGTGGGNMYGLAFAHPNAGALAKAAGHQLLVLANGATQVALGSTIWSIGSVTTEGSVVANVQIRSPQYINHLGHELHPTVISGGAAPTSATGYAEGTEWLEY